jgi:hypothetical protein
MPNDCPNGSINLNNGTITGSFKDECPFTFTLFPTLNNDVTVIGKDENGNDCSWFSPDPATIPAGKNSVPVTADMASGAGWFTYTVTGMNTSGNAHVVVGDSMPVPKGREHEKKAS